MWRKRSTCQDMSLNSWKSRVGIVLLRWTVTACSHHHHHHQVIFLSLGDWFLVLPRACPKGDNDFDVFHWKVRYRKKNYFYCFRLRTRTCPPNRNHPQKPPQGERRTRKFFPRLKPVFRRNPSRIITANIFEAWFTLITIRSLSTHTFFDVWYGWLKDVMRVLQKRRTCLRERKSTIFAEFIGKHECANGGCWWDCCQEKRIIIFRGLRHRLRGGGSIQAMQNAARTPHKSIKNRSVYIKNAGNFCFEPIVWNRKKKNTPDMHDFDVKSCLTCI